MRTIDKPWGKEEWLELNNKYCYKKIYLNKDQRTSFQYHNKKLETSYVLSGKIEVLLENEKGEIESKIRNPGDYFTIEPPRKHRVIAIEDAVYLEVSTPEVNDVVRLEDDFARVEEKKANN